MKKLLGIVSILLFAAATVFASFLTPAIGDGRVIPIGDDFYSYVDALFISTGNAIPSTSRPWTVTEARNEVIRLLGGVIAGCSNLSALPQRAVTEEVKREEESQDDDTISDYALSYLIDGMEE